MCIRDSYNDYWSKTDDSQIRAPLYCKAAEAETLRLSREDQRRNGQFLMESFMRYFVGDEFQFAPYWKGQARFHRLAARPAKAVATNASC